MADTVRTLSEIQTLLADNSTGAISPQDVRDFLVSAWPDSLISTATDNTSRSFTTNNTYEDVSGASITFSPALSDRSHKVWLQMHWRCSDSSWNYHQVRMLMDGGSSGVTPTAMRITERDASEAGSSFTTTVLFEVIPPSTASTTVKLQTRDNGSNLDRVIEMTNMQIWGPQ